MKRLARFTGVPLLLGLCGLGPWGAAPARAQEPGGNALAKQALDVLSKNCGKCHGVDHLGGRLDVFKYQTLIRPNRKTFYVVAKDLKKSYLYERVVNDEMPPDKPISAAEKDVIKKWIEAGAPEFKQPPPPARLYVSHKDVLLAVRDHLRAADHEDRPYLRYFTLANLHNDPKVSDAQLGRLKAALSKALNSMHWKKGMVIPQPVSKDNNVVLWIDLRDLDWDRKEHEKVDRWTVMLYRYPYGIDYENSEDDGLVDADKEISKLTRHTLVHVRADWFVSQATRPPVYEALLRLPANARQLEEKLGVDIAANFKRNRLWRAGFVRSGVSTQNRMIERHDALYGAYWKSYDFKRGKDQSDLLQFPLGPASFARAFGGKYPYLDVAFKHDGGEVIFNLPNGLQGYFLTNGKDDYIPEGPTDVVRDKVGEFSGGPEIVNGLSCMCCHAKGMVEVPPAGDEVRNGSAVLGVARRKVRKVYAPKETLAAKMEEDVALFLASAKKATLPFLVGEDRDKAEKNIGDVTEPVGEMAKLYNPDVRLERAAYELGYKTPDELKAAIKGNPKLVELGLRPLVNGGSVKLTSWQNFEGQSLFQRAARDLGIGSARKVR
jgi:serine/threonine-protein kinase